MRTKETVLAEARERLSAGASIRGLPKPADAPAGAWWAVQRRRLATGEVATYLFFRWTEGPRRRARCVGRLA